LRPTACAPGQAACWWSDVATASVFRKNGKYYARWKDAAGRWRRQATSCQTKRDAQRDADDLERKAERQRKGLEPLAEDAPRMTFAELFEWWWKEYGSRLRGDNEAFARKRLLLLLGGLAVAEVTAAKIEGALQGLSDELSPKSLNGLRGNVHTIFARAIERGLWQGQNPAKAVKRRKVPRKVFDTLRADEVPALLAALTPQWRPLFACAVYTGMRKGELLGLRKSDVDLVEGTITVRRSYDHDTTKGGHADVLPIAQALQPLLEEAIEASNSEFVFPASDGSMRTDETDLQQVLRRAMGRAGLVRGYLHVCRRKGCGHEEQAEDSELRPCPSCKMKLWPKALPRPLRFHDLRGTTATLLARAGVPLVVAQRMLRHADPRLTANVYTRVDLADLRAGVARLPPLVPTVSPRPDFPKTGQDDPIGNPKQIAGLDWSGRQDLNLRPPGPELLRRRSPLVRRLVTASQALEIRKGDRHAKLLNPRLATTCEARFVAPVSPATAPRLPSCRANRFSRSRKSQPDWASAAQSPTACASEVSCRTSASLTRSASRLPR